MTPNVSVEVDQAELAAALTTANRAVTVDGSTINPFAFQGAWLTLAEERFSVSATGPIISVEVDVEASRSVGVANAVVPIAILAKLAPALERGPVELTFGKDRLGIRAHSFRGILDYLNPNEFAKPRAPAAVETAVKVDGSQFKDALRHVAIGLRSPRLWSYQVESIVITPTMDGSVSMFATDYAHLAIASPTVPSAHEPRERLIAIPAIAALLLLRLVRSTEPVHLGASREHIEVQVGATTIRAARSAERIPDPGPMTLIEPTHRVEIARRTLATVMRRAGLFITHTNRTVWFEFEGGRSVARVNAPDVGQVQVRFKAGFEGEPCEIGFQFDVLKEAVEHLTEGRVVIEFGRPNKAALIFNPDRPAYRYYTFPIAGGHQPWRIGN